MSEPAIQVDSVTKSFADVPVVKGISLSIGEGEFFSLLGPSGCGKTTLLRMIAGFEQPTTGSVHVGGKNMANVPPHKRPVNMVFQSYALFPHLTVFENIAFGLKIAKRCPASEISQRVKEALELVRLPNLAQRYPRELSGGQQQRVAFARAIVNKPFVLLLDEPLSALDPRIREEMQTELARFKKELGITFVMVTHDQSEAFALSDRVAVFNAGVLEQVGTPQEIYERPQSAFVADFIGHTNILPAKVVESDGARAVLSLSESQRLRGVLQDGMLVSPNDDVIVWIRTDEIDLKTEAHAALADDLNILEGTILHRSYQGNTSDFVIKVGELTITASIPEEQATKVVGNQVTVVIATHDTHILSSPAPAIASV